MSYINSVHRLSKAEINVYTYNLTFMYAFLSYGQFLG